MNKTIVNNFAYMFILTLYITLFIFYESEEVKIITKKLVECHQYVDRDKLLIHWKALQTLGGC